MSHSDRRHTWRLIIGVLALALLGWLGPQIWRPVPPGERRPLAARQPSMADSAPRLPAPDVSSGPAKQLQIAPLGPLVAEQIELDPSLPETPAYASAAPEVALEREPTLTASRGKLELNDASAPMGSRLVDPSRADALKVEPLDLPPLRELADPPMIAAEADSASAFPETKAWPYPAGLVEQLNVLAATTPASADWAERAKREIDAFTKVESFHDPAVPQHLDTVQRLADEGRALATSLAEEQGRSRTLRAGYALFRRLKVWEMVHALSARAGVESAPAVDPLAWQHYLAAIEQRLYAVGAAATNWRTYLMLDRVRTDFDSSACSPADQRQLARDVLYRLHSTQLSSEQSRFLCSPPFEGFGQMLTARAAEPVDLRGVLTAIEAHEHDDASANARALAAQYDVLRWSPDERVRELSDVINAYYRNANVRVALSAALINRMIPAQQPRVEAVQDVIQGADVYGQSYTNTQLRLVLIPDAERWNIGLEANGSVASDTESSKGPARFFQEGVAFFRARKRVTVDHKGIRLFNAEAGANAKNQLHDFETEFDGIPLFSNLARSFVRTQYDETQPAAKQEVEGKIVWRATSQLDQEVATKLEQGKRDFQVRFIKPLQELDLEPTTVHMETTAERLIGRMRLADRDQIGARTPRPQAPGDSVLSVQLHESAFNNALENLALEGRRVELRDLYTEMTTRFDPTPEPVPDELPEEVYVTFADEDAVRIDCQDGQVRLTIRLKELAHERSKWHNFTVRGYYAPNADQLDANLVRVGVIELIGEKLRFGDQVALRAIFSRVLSKNRKLSLVNRQIAEAPELRDQQVTQFIIHDGWMGIALGPKVEGREAKMHPRPLTDEELQSE